MYFMEYTVTFKYMYPTCSDQIGVIAIYRLRHSPFLCAEGAVTKKDKSEMKAEGQASQ